MFDENPDFSHTACNYIKHSSKITFYFSSCLGRAARDFSTNCTRASRAFILYKGLHLHGGVMRTIVWKNTTTGKVKGL